MSIIIQERITEALNSDYNPCRSDWNFQGYMNCLGKSVCAEVDQNSNETCKSTKDLYHINRGSVCEQSSFGTLKMKLLPNFGMKYF